MNAPTRNNGGPHTRHPEFWQRRGAPLSLHLSLTWKNLKQFAIWDAGIRDCLRTVGLSNLL